MASSRKPSTKEPEAAAGDEAAPSYEVQGQDRWSVEEHVRSSQALYGQPSWLIAALLKGHDDPEGYTQAYVQEKVDAYNTHSVYGEGNK